MAKKKLLVDNEYEFFLYGISCPEKVYRLCSALNQSFGATFSKSKNMEVREKGKRINSSYVVFLYRDEIMFTDYRIIVNKADATLLIPEYKQADYLLMVEGGMPASEKNGIFRKIKEVPFVQAVFEIDPKKVKSKDNFVF